MTKNTHLPTHSGSNLEGGTTRGGRSGETPGWQPLQEFLQGVGWEAMEGEVGE